jgi:hypothetical protein
MVLPRMQGRIQFFIDAIDSAVVLTETLDIINRFPINLELELGQRLTQRATYTGVFNVSLQAIDMGFRVQCSDDYYGSDCSTFCRPLAGVNMCENQEGIVCIQNNRDPSTNCSTCLQEFLGENCDIPGKYTCNVPPCISL